jgi:thiosulfate reductase cytochrome b subunit
MLITVAGSLLTAGLIVLFARWLLGIPALQAFITEYPGETALPDGAPIGLPAWLGWQHFLNVFLMVLIIRSGLAVRREKRPAAYWASKRTPQRKISLMLWFHQSLDFLWLTNGAVFIVLLFVTGQWMRVVPMSWEVLPNALSALLQYASFDWPTENGWVNYNSLQVLAYFVTVFIAAPLAALTGVRMSALWPQRARRLSAAFPVEWARALHFPTTVYFCGFIAVHVLLVFATGILRNLNHMYGGQDNLEWTGLWIFTGSIAFTITAWVLARPLVLATIARIFGPVTAR